MLAQYVERASRRKPPQGASPRLGEKRGDQGTWQQY